MHPSKNTSGCQKVGRERQKEKAVKMQQDEKAQEKSVLDRAGKCWKKVRGETIALA